MVLSLSLYLSSSLFFFPFSSLHSLFFSPYIPDPKTYFLIYSGIILLRNSFARYLAPLVSMKHDEDDGACVIPPFQGRGTPNGVDYDHIRSLCDIEDIPEVLNDDFKCSKCPQLLNCTLYQKLISYANIT